MARKTPEEAARTRRHLIDTALVLFSRQGIENTTLKQVAAAAGVTHGALYWHFRNRADLLQHIHHHQALPFEAHYLEQRQGVHQDALAALRLYVQGVLTAFVRQPAMAALYRVFYMPSAPIADLSALQAELIQNRRQWCDQLRYFLKQARKQKQLPKNCAPRATAFLMQTALEGVLQAWLRSEGEFDLNQQGEALLSLLLGGLAQE
ncbi:TetR family transcriptional regulator [Marinobacterium weihaiense]|uniref:TetR family transcriptional regulator n=1 Tax=Marinobacterium weihaiense TaxID=2851016 RepID=A0ABS6ME75_9GAMM|nr:TetR family transcriptional regulator [Marinobacterium weihaiense]MBV0934618.1 TetR family transcriptional regulator [Marinobacterium weihaiense]